ncbi:protein kinase [endosymbiont GvMRE of Glomus versiforme]|uniref:protein kinase n=1 Tax=endosymbiont GvMRE of Glomus versiforme TaxID=2039283 RepID=UPI001FEC5F4A|nr:protein kinase [endosymbiont GvMRE of Glomus versiforme]
MREKDHYYENRDKFKLNKKYHNYKTVVLKSLTNSQTNADFLQETAKHKIIDDWFDNIVPCYGISQDSKTGNYLMVMQYIPQGNLRDYLKNSPELSFKEKLERLVNIAQGLKDIHQKNLVHRDFHLGNILNNNINSFITDLGLCKPADEASKQEKTYGVMPVAPEVLNSRPYTQAADIYSFGIIAYEMLSGLPPYYERAHDVYLGLEICQGLHSKFQIKISQLLVDLISKCWTNYELLRFEN